MNTKVISGLIVALVVLGGAYVYLHTATPAEPTAQTPAAATTTISQEPTHASTSPKEPTFTFGTPVRTPAVTKFDTASLTSASHYPVITGTANIPKVSVIIYDALGSGVVGGFNIGVVDGHWTYASSVALPAGSYRVDLLGAAATTTATLTVTGS